MRSRLRREARKIQLISASKQRLPDTEFEALIVWDFLILGGRRGTSPEGSLHGQAQMISFAWELAPTRPRNGLLWPSLCLLLLLEDWTASNRCHEMFRLHLESQVAVSTLWLPLNNIYLRFRSVVLVLSLLSLWTSRHEHDPRMTFLSYEAKYWKIIRYS